MQICIGVRKAVHPTLYKKVAEIKGRGGNLSGELCKMLEEHLSGDTHDLLDFQLEMLEVLTEVKSILLAVKDSGADINLDGADERTNNMLSMISFGSANDGD